MCVCVCVCVYNDLLSYDIQSLETIGLLLRKNCLVVLSQ